MPMVCVGETAQERAAGETKHTLHAQITSAFMHATAQEVGASVIAYEPVWAIGTGDYAKPHDVEKVVSYIRSQIKDLFGPKAARNIRVLYGGSVNDQNVASYLAIEGCDGALVGGASLNFEAFSKITKTAYMMQQQDN
jgi:triosephosphate isomerase